MSRIAVIQTAFPGDVILLTPVFESLKAAGHYVVAVVRPQAEQLIHHNKYIDKIICFEKQSGLISFIKTATELKNQNCDMALIVQRHLRSALLAVFAGIEKRIGFDNAPVRFLYTEEVAFNESQHEVERCLALCQRLSSISGYSPKIFILKNIQGTAIELLKSLGIISNNYIVLAPGSIWKTKRWTGYANLARLLCEEFSSDIILLGSADDRQLCEEIMATKLEHTIDLSGKTDLLLSTAIIEKARLAITNDSAPAHIAAAVNTPVVTIFGPTVPQFGFAPYNQKSAIVENMGLYCRPCSKHGPNRCPERHFRCMLEVTPEMVLSACKKLMTVQ